MIWTLAHRADPFARDIADRHYSRQSVGDVQFVKPGRCLVLKALTSSGRAYWVTSWQAAEHVKHRWPGAWECAAFRNEGAGVASDLVRQGVAATLARYGSPPASGMITFVDTKRVRPTTVRGRKVWGWCFIKAGFVEVGETEVNKLLVLQLAPDLMPEPRGALGTQRGLDFAA